MSIVDHKDGSITLTCECPGCEFVATYADEKEAFDAGWDGVGVVKAWAPSCPLCPGVPATFGVGDHSEAHAKWAREGRPEEFSSEGYESGTGGAMPQIYVDVDTGRYAGRKYD